MFKFKKSNFDRLLTPLIICVVLSLAAGIVGSLTYLTFFAPATGGDVIVEMPISPPLEVSRVNAARLKSPDAASRASVFVFVAKTGDDLPSAAYVGAEAIGAGMVLTSDGWVVLHDSAFGEHQAAKLRILVDGRMHPVGEIVHDDYSGAAFLRVDARDLSVMPVTNSKESLRPGDQLFAVDEYGAVRELSVASADFSDYANADEIVWSSDRLNRFVLCDANASILPGTVILNENGEVVGIVKATIDQGIVVVPASVLSDVISGTLKDGKVTRATLGLTYVDLSEPVALPESHDGKKGAVVMNVAKNSPAAIGGIRTGDVITAINDESVTERRTLSETLSTYYPDTVIQVTLVRNKLELDLNVKLGE